MQRPAEPQNDATARRSARLGRLAWRGHGPSLGVLVVALGLLLWAKLVLVTGHPRTAIARPDSASETAPER
ncbi:MAG TPA: hypothetical protein VD963_01680 [Phycisphaerales bacterium]|nr:hypothetical protein [Phycisphaerales bacterium]